MKTIKLNIFEFDELSEKAKQKALEAFADFNIIDDWFQFVFENFAGLGKLLGLTIPVKDIYFRGFYSQGDGSGFNAEVDIPELLKAITSAEWETEYPNTGLEFVLPQVHPAVLKLMAKNKIDIVARIEKCRGCYAIDASITEELPERRPRYHHIQIELKKLQTWFKELAELLNNFLYKSLQQEYDYLTSVEAIIDAIKANEYHFTDDGRSANRLQQLAQNAK